MHVWALGRVRRRPALILAEDYARRFESEATFRASQSGRRSRFPKTEKGVLDAVARADALLRARRFRRA